MFLILSFSCWLIIGIIIGYSHMITFIFFWFGWILQFAVSELLLVHKCQNTSIIFFHCSQNSNTRAYLRGISIELPKTTYAGKIFLLLNINESAKIIRDTKTHKFKNYSQKFYHLIWLTIKWSHIIFGKKNFSMRRIGSYISIKK